MLHSEMGLWARTGRFTKAALLLAVGALGGGAALAVASVPDSNGVIHACYSITTDAAKTAVPSTGAPNLTVIDPSAGQTCDTTASPAGAPATQRAVNWNVSGPQGPPGSPGSQGPPGSPGLQGPQGPAGNTATVTKGGTLTLAGGQVLGVESTGGAVRLPTPGRNLPGGSNVVLGSGGGAVNFPILDVSMLGSQGGAAKASIHDISFTKKIDKSSPTIFKACATGKHFPVVKITLRKAGGEPYLRYTLSNALVSAIQSAGTGGQTTPTEQVSLNFTKVQVSYLPQS